MISKNIFPSSPIDYKSLGTQMAIGGACNYFLLHLSTQNGWNKKLAYVLSFIVFIFGLWIGTILGLAGTLWN